VETLYESAFRAGLSMPVGIDPNADVERIEAGLEQRAFRAETQLDAFQ
jgi:hypothetical protein